MLDDILLVLKKYDQVVGHLYAQHYIERGLVFISYLGIDLQVSEASRRGVELLLDKLLGFCNQASKPWKAILGEVEETKDGSSQHAQKLFSVFRRQTRKVQQKLGGDGKLFMIDLEYKQPAVRPEDVSLGSDSERLNQALLYFAKDTKQLGRDEIGYYLTEDMAANVFDTLLMCVYGDAFPDKRYQNYLTGRVEELLFEVEYREKLGERLRLKKNKRQPSSHPGTAN